MEDEYKQILLTEGLENITDEELKKFIFFIPEKYKNPRGKLDGAHRTEVAQLLIENVGVASAVRDTVTILKKMHCNNIAKHLEEERKKVYTKYKMKNETESAKKENQAKKTASGASAARGPHAVRERATSKVARQSKETKQKDPSVLHDPNSRESVAPKEKTERCKEGDKHEGASFLEPKMRKSQLPKSGAHSSTKVTKATKAKPKTTK